MKPILFLVSAASSYRLQKLVADECVRRKRAVAYLYERGHDDTFDVISRDAVNHGARAEALEPAIEAQVVLPALYRLAPNPNTVVTLDEFARRAAPPPAPEAKKKTDVVSRLLSRFRHADVPPSTPTPAEPLKTAVDPKRLLPFRTVLGEQLAAASRLLRDLNPAAIVACEDGISTMLSVHAVARSLEIPVIEVPYGYGVQADLEISLEAKAARNELLNAVGPEGDLVRRFAPQWIKRGRFEGAVMFPPSYILAAESLGITLRDAWIIHGGYADRLCAESEQMLGVYRGEGIPETKLRLTGSPYCDVMARAVDHAPDAKAALRQPRRIDPSSTRILVSWPPSYHDERGAHSEFPTYAEMSLAVLGWLKGLPRTTVTVSVHPAMPADQREAIVNGGVALTDEYVIDLIPRHDLFITYFSSTIRWAIAAGKPVVNYDAYRLGLDVYAGAPAVYTVNTMAAFQSIVSELVGSDSAFLEAAERQTAVAAAWGLLDGRSTERICGEIEQLART